MGKLFMVSFAILIFFNMLTYLTGITAIIFDYSSLISGVVTLGIIAIALAMIPLTSGAGVLKWFFSMILLLMVLFSVTFTILTFNVTIGIGLCTNMMSLFPSVPTEPLFIGYLFFLMLGILGIADIMMSGV